MSHLLNNADADSMLLYVTKYSLICNLSSSVSMIEVTIPPRGQPLYKETIVQGSKPYMWTMYYDALSLLQLVRGIFQKDSRMLCVVLAQRNTMKHDPHQSASQGVNSSAINIML